jgi:ABC-2 type transport system ATP-binding protein
MSSANVVLSTLGLTKKFGSLAAVTETSLTVREGDVYGLLGLNGAGKTTTLRMVLGLLRPTRGSIEILGRTATFGSPVARRGLGAFIEGPAAFGQLTARENLELLAPLGANADARRAFDRDALEQLLEDVGLADVAQRRVRTFSLGMRQRLGIALALAPSPQLVILDEPTNGLDPRGIRDIRELVLKLNAKHGLTFVVSSHLLHEVENLCGRVGIMHAGRLVDEGPLEELMREGVQTLRIEASPRDDVIAVLGELYQTGSWREVGSGFEVAVGRDAAPALCDALVRAGVRVSAIVPHRPSLEELFIARTEGAA